MTRRRPVYLDHQATTPLDPRVLQAMLPWLAEEFGNAASLQHAFGWTAESAVNAAREEIAEGLGAQPREIVFTSGATMPMRAHIICTVPISGQVSHDSHNRCVPNCAPAIE